MNTVNIDRLTAVLSGILTDKYGKQITATLQEGNNEDAREDHHSDSRIDDYGRRLRTG